MDDKECKIKTYRINNRLTESVDNKHGISWVHSPSKEDCGLSLGIAIFDVDKYWDVSDPDVYDAICDNLVYGKPDYDVLVNNYDIDRETIDSWWEYIEYIINLSDSKITSVDDIKPDPYADGNQIYIITNSCYKDDIVKIGISKRISQRLKELQGAGVPGEFRVYATYDVPTVSQVDKCLHALIDIINPDLRISDKKEWYRMLPEDAYKVLENIAIITGTQGRLHKYGK